MRFTEENEIRRDPVDGRLVVLAPSRLAWNLIADELVDDPDGHLTIRLLPRGTVLAGIELVNGVSVNPVMPEAAAATYRRANRL